MSKLLSDLEQAIVLNEKLRLEHTQRPELYEESEEDLYTLLHTIQGISTEELPVVATFV